jgi:hypothetical protein
MATLVLGAAGAAIGGSIGGAILGVSAATIGGFVGSTIGSVVDSWIVSSLAPTQRIEGARLDTLRITSATEGAVIPRLYGRMRMGGNVIWATDFREETKTTTQGGGKGGGGGGKVKTTEYLYYASFAVALLRGPDHRHRAHLGRRQADGHSPASPGAGIRATRRRRRTRSSRRRWARPTRPPIAARPMWSSRNCRSRTYGNRLPQLSFEVFRPLADPDTAEGLTQRRHHDPGLGRVHLRHDRHPQGQRMVARGPRKPERAGSDYHRHGGGAGPAAGDGALRSRASASSWPGSANDLRAGSCKVRPGVEVSAKSTTPASWSVNGVSRASAFLVSRDDQDRPVYGGTPADFAVVQAIQEMKARGLRVTFYPFILMDVPPGNTLPNPYSATTPPRPASQEFPWRGRITCSPAAGYRRERRQDRHGSKPGRGLLRRASPVRLRVSGETVSWTGPSGDWGLRRMVLHYAHLCAAAGGVDAFLIGTEMPRADHDPLGPQHLSRGPGLRDLAADVRSILGAGTAISYAADWSEYFGHQPGDDEAGSATGSSDPPNGDVFFHLDPLWADPDVDFVGIDNYMPLSDWRDGFEHADAQEGWPAIYDRAYLQGNIAGGEGFDWFYASAADRSAQVRTAITDGASGKPWVFRYKDLRSWWSNPHYDRPGGVESGTPTAWAPQSKPIWFTELGCPAIDRGTNQPNVFFDPKSSESFVPYFSRGWRDDAIQRAYLEATYLWWGEAANNPVLGLRRPDGARPRMRRLDLGRAAVPVLSGADRRLDGRGELAAGALADRAARRGVAGGAGPAPLPARRAARGSHRRHRPLGRGRGLRHRRAREPAGLDHHARAAFRLRRRRDRRRDPLRHAWPGGSGERQHPTIWSPREKATSSN